MSGSSELDQLFNLAYEDLRKLATAVKRGDRSDTLTPTALVHEAWMRLADSPGLAFESEMHFKRIAARAMRRVLIEAARRREADKRGGWLVFVAVDEGADAMAERPQEPEALAEALERLERMNERHAHMVELRFFGGLTVAQTAEALGVSEETVHRDWRAVKAWLVLQLGAGE